MTAAPGLAPILARFALDGPAASWAPHGCGHINRTYRVTTAQGAEYILQRINQTAFPDVDALMENVSAVTGFLSHREPDPRRTLRLVPTVDGRSYLRAEDGSCWRVYRFIPGGLCLQMPETSEDLYQSALAFGGFLEQMAGFPAASLHETIPNFHNTPDRYRQLKEAASADPLGRASGVGDELRFYLDREERMGRLHRLRLSGELPLRVTHNDTKLNNVLLDALTRKSLCVLDLDTVMPGLAAYDFGDAIRFGAASAPEDEPDLSRMGLDLGLFQAFTRGFLLACPGLTAREVELLPLGALTMTVECGMRFLTDYLRGDVYFATQYPEHNLIRCRAQARLAADMEDKWDEMERIIKEEEVK